MPTTALERLSALKQELEGLSAEPWSTIESWTAKATPIIRRDWPDYFDDFRQAAATPRWKVHAGAVPGDNEETRADRSNRAIASSSKDKLLRFLDGLLAVAEPLPPTPRRQRSPGDATAARKRAGGKRKVDSRKVFVVHGRNGAARDALFDLLRAIGLHPLEWDEIVQETGEGSPYTGRVLEVGFSLVQAVVVLMTPDDEARLREPLRGKHEPSHETDLTPQPRPNVLVEAGMALGQHGNRTVIVEMGRLRPISDLFGRHVVRLDNTPQQRKALAQRLQTAGCTVNLAGNDWLSVGDFDNALPPTTPSLPASPTLLVPLFPSDGVLWASSEVSGHKVYRPHCPHCQRPLNRKADFVECSCGFTELLTRREPSVPGGGPPKA